MRTLAFPLRRAGTFAVPASVFFLLLTLCPGPLTVSAHQRKKGKRITDSILGVKIGMRLIDAHEKLERFGTTGSREGDKEEEREEAGERKEAWSLSKTQFSSVALKANREGKVVWVTGFVRPGQEIPFAKLGELAQAFRANELQAIWNVETSKGAYRLVAKGQKGKARVVYLLSLDLPPIQ